MYLLFPLQCAKLFSHVLSYLPKRHQLLHTTEIVWTTSLIASTFCGQNDFAQRIYIVIQDIHCLPSFTLE